MKFSDQQTKIERLHLVLHGYFFWLHKSQKILTRNKRTGIDTSTTIVNCLNNIM